MIDSHAHLDELSDLPGALARARAAGVQRIITVGMDLASNRRNLEIGQEYPELVAVAGGYHPWALRGEEVEANIAFLAAHLSRLVALGEIGLDYKAKVKKSLQREVFGRLLALARQAELPVIIHTRFSYARALAMVREAGITRAVFHWYSGPLDILRAILDAGYLVSATPALAYSEPHQAVVRYTPLERLLLETDAPVEYEGRASEPADLVRTALLVSNLKNIPLVTVAQLTTQTALEFFGLEAKDGGAASGGGNREYSGTGDQ